MNDSKQFIEEEFPPFSKRAEHAPLREELARRLRSVTNEKALLKIYRETQAELDEWAKGDESREDTTMSGFWEMAAENVPFLSTKLVGSVAFWPSALKVLMERPDFSATPPEGGADSWGERVALFLVEHMAKHPGRVKLMGDVEAGLALLRDGGYVPAQSRAGRRLLLEIAELKGGLRVHDGRTAAHRLVAGMRDLSEDDILLLLYEAPHPNVIITLAQHPAAGLETWSYIARWWGDAVAYASCFTGIPAAMGVPEVWAMVNSLAKREISLIPSLLPYLKEKVEFDEAFRRLVAGSSYYTLVALESLDVGVLGRLGRETIADLLASDEPKVRLAALRIAGRMGEVGPGHVDDVLSLLSSQNSPSEPKSRRRR